MSTSFIDQEISQPFPTYDLPPVEDQSQILRALLDQPIELDSDDPIENDMILNMGPRTRQHTGCCGCLCGSTAKPY